MSYTFDGDNKLITLTAGTTTLSLPDLYSKYKEWFLQGNSEYLIAFETVGGDIPQIPLYLFLINGWKIVPQSANHTLTVTDGILIGENASDPFQDPIGSYAIRINREAPGIAVGYETGISGLTPQESSMLTNMPTEVANVNIEGTLSLSQTIKILLAALVGKTTGIGTNEEIYLAQNGTTPRITATFDANGNRITIVLDGV